MNRQMDKMNKKILLASASPRRKELLGQIGIEFEVRKSNAEENIRSENPWELVMALSGQKALDVFEGLSEEEKENSLVIGADTVVSLEGVIMGKPKNEEDAVRMLTALQGRTHQVYTGVTLIYRERENDARVKNTFFEKTDVSMFPMSSQEIDDYVATKEPMDKAGAYGIQGRCAAYIRGIAGDYNNVVGLPIGRLFQELKVILSD